MRLKKKLSSKYVEAKHEIELLKHFTIICEDSYQYVHRYVGYFIFLGYQLDLVSREQQDMFSTILLCKKNQMCVFNYGQTSLYLPIWNTPYSRILNKSTVRLFVFQKLFYIFGTLRLLILV